LECQIIASGLGEKKQKRLVLGLAAAHEKSQLPGYLTEVTAIAVLSVVDVLDEKLSVVSESISELMQTPLDPPWQLCQSFAETRQLLEGSIEGGKSLIGHLHLRFEAASDQSCRKRCPFLYGVGVREQRPGAMHIPFVRLLAAPED
jgi:hypothetical protein